MSTDNLIVLAISLLENFVLALMKTDIHVGVIFILYGILGLGLRFIIQKKGIVAGNATYDILGILGSSLIAFFYFGDKLKSINILGILLAIVALFLLNM